MSIDDPIPSSEEWIHLSHVALHEKEPNRDEWRTLVSNGMWVIQVLREEVARYKGDSELRKGVIGELVEALEKK